MRVRPWYTRTLRWGQTNLTELDPSRYDDAWWRSYWRHTNVQGVIVNAGGIVAYYPSRFPLHKRAKYLEDRDLYGHIVRSAREEGLAVLARMDSNRAAEDFYHEHPDWFAVDREGAPYRAGELYVACVNSPYYTEFLPAVLEEIIDHSHPDGFADNSWSGLESSRICYCPHCTRLFREDTGQALPRQVDWDAPEFRTWIEWSYARRLAVWDLNNATTTRAGGADCRWIGMIAGDIEAQSRRLRDTKAICERTPIIMLDSQGRGAKGFQANGDSGKLLHGLLGWDVLIPESTAMYDGGLPTFRLGSKPEPEVRMWAVEGFAAGIQPWWHHIGSHHEDRRQYQNTGPLFAWHEEHDEHLVGRTPVANVGLVWSQRSVDFHGRDDPGIRSVLPYRGFADALVRARIPYLPVHVDHVERDLERFEVLVVPNVGALTHAQREALRGFAHSGGSLVVTGESGLYDEWGDPHEDPAWSELLGVAHTGTHHGTEQPVDAGWDSYAGHSYLRIEENGKGVTSVEDTELLPGGGRLEVVTVTNPDARTFLTWVPPFPIYPPETSWMRRSHSELPAIVGRVHPRGGRIAYLATDLDRSFGRYHHPDHGRTLADVVRWAARDTLPLQVEGPGIVDCHLFRRGEGFVLHLVNLSQGGAWQGRLDELTAVGPLTVRIEAAGRSARLLVMGTSVEVTTRDGWTEFVVPEVVDHEVIVLE